MKISTADSRDLNAGIARICRSCEVERISDISRRQNRYLDGLAIAVIRAPGQGYPYRAPRRTAKPDASDVLLPFRDGKPRLANPVWRLRIQLNPGALLANKRTFFIHRHKFIRADRTPLLDRRAPGPALPLRFVRLRRDRKIELAVIEHLSPQRSVHRLSDVLDEHAEHILRHRRRRLPRVNVRENCLGRSGFPVLALCRSQAGAHPRNDQQSGTDPHRQMPPFRFALGPRSRTQSSAPALSGTLPRNIDSC